MAASQGTHIVLETCVEADEQGQGARRVPQEAAAQVWNQGVAALALVHPLQHQFPKQDGFLGLLPFRRPGIFSEIYAPLACFRSMPKADPSHLHGSREGSSKGNWLL